MPPQRATVRRIGWFYCRPDWSWTCRGSSLWPDEPNPATWNHNLWTVLEGRGTLDTPGGAYTLRPGDCFVLRGTEQYRARHDPAEPLVVVAVHFDYLDDSGAVLRPEGPASHRRLDTLDFVVHLLERLDSAWHGSQPDRAETWLRAVLAEVARQDQAQRWHGSRRRQAARIEDLARRIRNHPERDYRLASLARELHCSQRHVSRLFREVLGCSPQTYLVRARIEAAQGLLHASSYPISRIAELTGYRDLAYFSRHFKQHTGRSPSATRRHGTGTP